MRIDSKAFSKSASRSARRRAGGLGAVAGTAALVMGLGLAVVCFTPDSPAAPAETAQAAEVAKIETAPIRIRVAAAPRAPVQVAVATPAPQAPKALETAAPTAPQTTAQTPCNDPAYAFLNAACQTAVKRHISRHHRSVTFVAGNAAAVPPAAVATVPTPPVRQQVSTRPRPTVATSRPAPADRPLSLSPPLKTAQQGTPAVTAE